MDDGLLDMAKSLKNMPKGAVVVPVIFFKEFDVPDKKEFPNLRSVMEKGYVFLGLKKLRFIFFKRVRVGRLYAFSKTLFPSPFSYVVELPTMFLSFQDLKGKDDCYFGHIEGTENIERFLEYLCEA